MSTPVTNFGKVTVSTGYTSSATSIVLTTGHGSRLPNTFPYPLIWWNSTDYTDPADDPNREIVTVTARTSDTLTVTRAAESTTASNKNTASKTYTMVLSITKAMWDSVFDLSLTQSFRNLTLQTHPDSDVAASKVSLTHADAIVMSDGEEVADWNDLVADITVSSVAGGLDTGTEANSTWYSIHAIRKSTDNTRALLLHRAKNYTAAWTSNTGEDGQVNRDATARTKIAQGVTPSTAGVVPFIDVKMLKAGSPTGNYYFTIHTDNGGLPSTTVLATSDKYDASRLTTTATWIRVPFRTPASLSASTQYHVVLQGDFSVNASNYISWRADTTSAAVTGGSAAVNDGTTWTNTGYTAYDMMLILYAEANDTDIKNTLPTGYDQYALIGWVYNNSSGNFKHFWQKDRTVFCGYDADWKIGQMTATVSLFALDAFAPPIPVLLSGIVYAGTAAHYAVGHLTAMDVDATATNTKVGAVRGYVGSGETYASAQVMIDYSAMMTVAGSGTDLYVDTYTW